MAFSSAAALGTASGLAPVRPWSLAVPGDVLMAEAGVQLRGGRGRCAATAKGMSRSARKPGPVSQCSERQLADGELTSTRGWRALSRATRFGPPAGGGMLATAWT